ncbi:MAG: fimbrillin family protein [Candidatus Limisoma sp.]
MNTKTTKSAIFALLAGAVVSCSNDAPTADNQRVAVDFRATIGVASRAVDTSWSAGDAIGIFMVNTGEGVSPEQISEGVNNIKYVTPNADGAFSPAQGSPTIYFPIEGQVDFVAYYPYTDNVVATNIPDVTYGSQEYVVPVSVADQSNQEAIDVMHAGCWATNKYIPQVALRFYHILSKVVFDVVPGDGLTQADLANLSITVKQQNTTGVFSVSHGHIFEAATPADVTMHAAIPGSRYEAILLPDAANSRVVEFNLNNGHDAPFVWTMPVTLEKGKKYHYTTVRLSRTAAEVSGSIVPWDETVDDSENIAK